jgi:hypothetical protein
VIYRYRTDDGRVTEVDRPMGPQPDTITLEDGTVAKRVWGALPASGTKGWPMECLASGVNAEQAQDLRDEFKRVGVPTEVSADGNPIYTSAAHRKRALKARGFFDRASYG